jgi:hypothetical protein
VIPGQATHRVRAGKKPFAYASDRADTTDRAVADVLENRPGPLITEQKKLPPAPLFPSDGVFSKDNWGKWKKSTRLPLRIEEYRAAVFPGDAFAKEIVDQAWPLAESYIDACTMGFSPLAVVRTGVRGTILIEAVGGYKEAGAAVRAI